LPPGTNTVVPALARHVFEPPNATIVLGPSRSDVNFRALQTYTLSGRVTENGLGVFGVNISAGGRTSTTDVNGNYTLSSVPAGTNIVRAALNGYEITPAQQQVVVSANQTGVDFTARGLFYIRGRITDSKTSNGFAGVIITAGRYSSTNDSAGFYTITNMGPGTYAVVPSATGRGFGPSFATITIAPSAEDADFISFPVFKLSGKVTREGSTNPIAGVTIRATSDFGTNVVFTDANGAFNFAALREGNYVLTPSLTGNSFDPPTLEVPLFADAANQNFVGYVAFSISGRVTEAGGGVPGVEVTAAGSTNPILVAVTDNAGNYTLGGLRPDTYSLYPVRPGYDITPQPRNVKVGPSTNNVNFAAGGILTISGTVREGTNTVAGISLVLTSTNPPSSRSVVTDTNGNYRFKD